jgi:hypothetical protein
MKVTEGRKIALAVDAQWYKAVEAHRFLKDGPKNAEQPTELLSGSIEDLDDINGVWLKPDEKDSDFSKASLFIPWRFIVTAMLMGPDEEQKLRGFIPR